jgi:hypothetical protein
MKHLSSTQDQNPVAPSRHRLRQTGSSGQLDGVCVALANAVNLCTDDAGLVLSPTQAFVSEYFVPSALSRVRVPFCGIWQRSWAPASASAFTTGYKCTWITRTELRKNVEADFIKDKFPISLLDVLSFKMASNAMSARTIDSRRSRGRQLEDAIIDGNTPAFQRTLPKSEAQRLLLFKRPSQGVMPCQVPCRCWRCRAP